MMEDIEEGIKVGGKHDVRFGDDHRMVSITESGLQRIIDPLSATEEENKRHSNSSFGTIVSIP